MVATVTILCNTTAHCIHATFAVSLLHEAIKALSSITCATETPMPLKQAVKGCSAVGREVQAWVAVVDAALLT